MFTAYFDASGESSSGVLAVAGCVSHFKKWQLFEQRWKDILQREGIEVFHMTDFASSGGEFKSWKGQTDRRRKFMSDLLECGRRNVNKAFAAVVIVRDYKEMDKRFQLREFAGAPYAMAGHGCVKMVKTWQKKNKKAKELEIAFESGDLHQGELRKLCLSEGIDPDFLGKKEKKATPFQLADLIAWRTRIAFAGIRRMDLTWAKGDELQATFNQVWKKFPHQAIYADHDWLERMCIRRGVARHSTTEHK